MNTIIDQRVTDLLRNRRSTRAFSTQPIDESELLEVFESVRWTPSSMNEQPWRFVYALRGTEAFDKLASTLFDSNRAWAHHAAVLIGVAASTLLARNGQPNKHAWYDTGQAVANFTVEASSRGWVMRQMGGFDATRFSEAFGLTPDVAPVVCLAVGFPGEGEYLDEAKRAAENGVRNRKPLNTIANKNNFPQ